MKPFLTLIAVSVFALSAVADPPALATIVSITPRLGTVTGGDTVTITVNPPLVSCVCTPPAYPVSVTFDGIPARSVSVSPASPDTIMAVTPSHAAGTVAVAVSQGSSYGTIPFDYRGLGTTPDSSNYEKVLVPLSLPAGTTPGAFGSQWSSELWASNPTPYAVELFNDISCTIVCIDPLPGQPGYPQLSPNSVVKLAPLTILGDYGFLYYVQKTYASDISFSLHVSDLSHAADNAGTEIGVVRGHDFRGASFDILNVPIDAVSRAALRVYDVNGSNSTSADVTFYSMSNGAVIASINVPLIVPGKKNTPVANAFPPFAGFGQIGDIRNQFAFIQSGFPSRVRVHVESHDGANQLWGFVSVTNNATQLITTYRPE